MKLGKRNGIREEPEVSGEIVTTSTHGRCVSLTSCLSAIIKDCSMEKAYMYYSLAFKYFSPVLSQTVIIIVQ